jgi:hypothetical protein
MGRAEERWGSGGVGRRRVEGRSKRGSKAGSGSGRVAAVAEEDIDEKKMGSVGIDGARGKT